MIETPIGLKKPEITDHSDLTVFIGQNMDLIDFKIKEINDDITTINESLSSTSSGMDNINNDISNINNEISNINNDLLSIRRVNQYSKLDVVAPYEKEITIPYNINFDFPSVEVLKFVSGEQNIITNIYDFNNADSTNFESQPNIVFDGAMKLQTSFSYDMVDGGLLGGGHLWTQTIDITNLKSIDSLEVV